jgi:hypothetical protein
MFFHIRKVSSGFEYFLPIFAIRLGQSLKVFGLDAEFNSASNGDIFEGDYRAKKRGEDQGESVWVRSSP